MSYDFVFAGGRLKCFKIDLNKEAEYYNRAGGFKVQEAVFNVSNETYEDLRQKGVFAKDKIIIVFDVLDGKMSVEFFPEKNDG